MRAISREKSKELFKQKQIVERGGKIEKTPAKIEPLDKLTAQVKSLVVAMSKPQQVIPAPDVQVNVPAQSPPVVNIEMAKKWTVRVSERDRQNRILEIVMEKRD